MTLEKIESRWEKETASYIQGYNLSKKFVKTVKKADLLWLWTQTYKLVTHEIFWQLRMGTRYEILIQLTND